MKLKLLLLPFLLLSSCGSLDLPGGRDHGEGGCTPPPRDFAGTFAADFTFSRTDHINGDSKTPEETGTFELVVTQYGPAVDYAGILGLASADALVIHESFTAHFGMYVYSVDWTGDVTPDGSTSNLVAHVKLWKPEDGGADTILQDYDDAYTITVTDRVF